ncbi:hypothetical protein B0H13DRAFT_2350794 [Mycena leptocephala]|nr:hypothetical protein B0H13DRAFT_2350794 [Mycena leptocephala]
MSLDLTFQSKDILNSHLNNGHSNLYTTSTDRGMLGRKVTSLEMAGSLSGSTGKIHWRDKTFELGGKTQKWKELEGSTKWFSLDREWEWSGYTYTVKHAHHKWTVTNSHGEVACLTEYKPHLFHDSEHATLRISPEIRDEHQRAFIILVLLYSETKRLDRKKAAAAAAG